MKITLLLLSFLLLACTEPSTPDETATELKIVYNVGYDLDNDNYEIFVVDLDGSNKKNITNRELVDWAYYAYKDKIYFLSDRDSPSAIISCMKWIRMEKR